MAFALLAAALPLRAETASGPATASARLELRVVIPVVLKVDALSAPALLRVEAHHVGQGYVDLDEATLVQVTSNSGGGLDLAVGLDGAVVRRAALRLLGRDVSAEGDGSVSRIDCGRLDARSIPVSYRLYLDPRVRPGTYRWPVVLHFSPVSA